MKNENQEKLSRALNCVNKIINCKEKEEDNERIKGSKEKSEKPLKDELLKLLLNFNIFETKEYSFFNFCHKNKYKISCKLKKVFDFFRNRYVTNGVINNNFQCLFNKDHVKDKNNNKNKDIYARIEKREKETSEILLNNDIGKSYQAVENIVYRFRNNLFHGNAEKQIDFLYGYYDCFVNINKFFKTIFEFYKEVYFSKNNA